MALQSHFFNRRESTQDAAAARAKPQSATLPAALQAVSDAANTPSMAGPDAAPVRSTSPDGEARLTVGPNIKLRGVEITDCHTLVVDGSIEATMDARLMQISERGAFKGSASIDNAEIRGHFEGQLTVRERLVVHATGRVTGQVRYGRLVVEEGGQLSGDVVVQATQG